MIKWFLKKFKWTFVATIEGPTWYVDDKGERTVGGNCSCYWNLYERGDGKRKIDLIGINRGSQAALQAEAKVKAWLKGGPVPEAIHVAKKAPPKKPNLISFPGGKDSA